MLTPPHTEVACARCESKPCECYEENSPLNQSDYNNDKSPTADTITDSMVTSAKDKSTTADTILSATSGCPNCSPKEIYIRLLQSLYLIYSSMERELRREDLVTSFPIEEILFADQLFRRSSLSRDLTYYLGVGWKSKLTSTRATDAYVARIREAAKLDPDLLLAHHSARYMGDLLSCDSSRARVRHLFGLPSPCIAGDGVGTPSSISPSSSSSSSAGVEFHDFGRIEDKNEFREKYFAKIRELELSPEVSQKLAKESKLVYQLNLNVYWELRNLVNMTEKDIQTSIDSKRQSLISQDGSNINKAEMDETASNVVPTDEGAERQLTKEVDGAKTKIRCRGMPLAFYSLVFWLLLWFVFGVVVWQGNWVNVGDILNYDETKKKILSFFAVEDNI